jgi:ectoine hydroxylase-related dioxygenase (phytanoyl-CoA dioxygenase family)
MSYALLVQTACRSGTRGPRAITAPRKSGVRPPLGAPRHHRELAHDGFDASHRSRLHAVPRPCRAAGKGRRARCIMSRVMEAVGDNIGAHADLTDEAVARFHREGFMVVTDLTTRGDLDEVACLLAGLYRRFQELRDARRAHDLGSEHDKARPILEINETVELEPRLANTLTFKRCAAVAQRLLGRPAQHRFDHAIYKPPFNGAATCWHQDEAYDDDNAVEGRAAPWALERKHFSAHFWVPLQDVTRDMGCMEFIPGSHRGVLARHRHPDRLREAHALELIGLDTTRAVACPVRAGEATVHLHRTAHYSGPNRTGTPRMAWALEFEPCRSLSVRLIAKARLVWQRVTR